MHVHAVRHRVAVQDVNLESLAWLRVYHCAGHAAAEHGLVYVCRHYFIRLWDEIVRIEVLAIDDSSQPPRVDLRLRNRRVLVTRVAHTVTPIGLGKHRLHLWLYRTVVWNLLDLEIDVTYSHFSFSFRALQL